MNYQLNCMLVLHVLFNFCFIQLFKIKCNQKLLFLTVTLFVFFFLYVYIFSDLIVLRDKCLNQAIRAHCVSEI